MCVSSIVLRGCSGEVVAGMIVADMFGEDWQEPEWFPSHYLTGGVCSVE